MKRSPLTRKTPLARGDGLKRTEIAQRKAEGKRRKASGFTPASPAQRDKVAERGCLVCTRGPCHPAHLVDRALGGTDDPRDVVPLCPVHHREYDTGALSLLEYLEPLWRDELARAVELVGLLSALQQITGQRWAPVSDSERPSCGCDNPAPGWQAGVSYCGNCGWHVEDASLGASEAAA